MRIKRLVALGLVLSMSVFAVACSKKAENTGDNSSTVVVEDTQSEVEVDDSQEAVDNEEVAVNEERVIASSVAVVQILDALGIPMVGVPTSSYELPESVAEATRIGSAMTPDLEVIASLEADVIVSVDSLSDDLRAQFDTLNLDSEFVNLNSYEGLKDTIQQLGDRFNVSEKASELVTSMEERETALADKITNQDGPSVLIIFGAGSSFMVASNDSYVGSLVQMVGGQNIITEAPSAFSPVDMEYLADKNPDYILFMAHANPEESLAAFKQEFETNQAWQNFDAVKNEQVVALDTSYFGMSANLYAIDALEKLVNILYGEN